MSASTPVMNWRILLKQSFTANQSLLMINSTLQLENIGGRTDMQTHAGNSIAACITSNCATLTVFVTL